MNTDNQESIRTHASKVMGITRRQWLATTVAATATSPLWALAQGPKVIVIQFSHVVTADTTKGRAALRFKELAESRTGGRVRVEVYPDSTLYKDREELEALRLGAVQMLAPSLSKLSALGVPDFEYFDQPFLFPDAASFRRVCNAEVGSALLKKLERNDIKGLAYWDNGFKVFTANRPLHVPTDLKGLRIRVQASKTLVSQMKALGADVSISPLTAVYEALRTGQLDAQENVPTNIESQRLHEVQSHLTLTHHGYLAYAVLVNKTFWDRLPSDVRTTLEGALRDATQFANQIAPGENQRALSKLKTSGRLTVHTPTAAELQLWKTAFAGVPQQQQNMNPAVLDAMRQAMRAPP